MADDADAAQDPAHDLGHEALAVLVVGPAENVGCLLPDAAADGVESRVSAIRRESPVEAGELIAIIGPDRPDLDVAGHNCGLDHGRSLPCRPPSQHLPNVILRRAGQPGRQRRAASDRLWSAA